MNWTETPWTKLHKANRWCAFTKDTHELICIHDSYHQLLECLDMLGLKDAAMVSKEMLGRGISKTLGERRTSPDRE